MKIKQWTALLLVLMLMLPLLGNAEQLVFEKGKAPEFVEGTLTLDIHVVPMIGGDCLILRCDGQVMLVDMGKENEYENIRSEFERLGIEKIDIAFNSHPHDDHLGSMMHIAEDYPVGLFLTAFDEDYDDGFCCQTETIAYLKEKNVPIRRVGDMDTFEFASCHCTVYQIPDFPDCNYMSALLLIEYGERRVLMTGDFIDGMQRLMAQSGRDIKAEIVKHPHHGLKPMYHDFIRAIEPQYAIITHNYSCSAEARDRLNDYRIRYGIAAWGPLHLATNGEYWLVDQLRD